MTMATLSLLHLKGYPPKKEKPKNGTQHQSNYKGSNNKRGQKEKGRGGYIGWDRVGKHVSKIFNSIMMQVPLGG